MAEPTWVMSTHAESRMTELGATRDEVEAVLAAPEIDTCDPRAGRRRAIAGRLVVVYVPGEHVVVTVVPRAVDGSWVPRAEPRHPGDRILWNRRPGKRDCGDIDEIVLHNVTVHVEQMDDRCWWIGIYTEPNDGDSPYWMGNFSANSRGVMTFGEQENSDVVWAKDEVHR